MFNPIKFSIFSYYKKIKKLTKNMINENNTVKTIKKGRMSLCKTYNKMPEPSLKGGVETESILKNIPETKIEIGRKQLREM